MDRPNILIVNDDGIEARGIRLLAEIAARIGDVWVVAPDSQCSAMSQRITIFDPLPIRCVDFQGPVKAAWSVGGTPADCVKAALNRLLPVRPDLLFSGVNNGYNTGFDIAYSGTIGAAMEGLMKGVPSYAFSTGFGGDFTVAEHELYSAMQLVLSLPTQPGELWNVNFPACALTDYHGVCLETSVAPTQLYLDRYEFEEKDDGSLLMHNRAVAAPADLAPEGSDVRAVLNGWTSVGRVHCTVLGR